AAGARRLGATGCLRCVLRFTDWGTAGRTYCPPRGHGVITFQRPRDAREPMAFVIVSAGHLTDSRLRTLRARPVLVAAATGALLLMAGCLALGFHLARLAAPVAAVPHATLDEPELRAIAN